jgi:GntR family transcriptional regulator
MINKNSQIPYYLQVRENLLKKIDDGVFKPEEKIPSEEELCKYYNVSRPTIRQAIKELINDGKLIIKKGKGTYAIKQKFESLLIDKIVSFADELKQNKIPFNDNIIEFKIIKPNNEIANILEISPDSDVIYYNRIRSIENEPLYNTRGFIIRDLCPGFINEKIENQSVFYLLEHEYNLDFYRIKRYLQPISTGIEESKLLEISVGIPIHYLETIIYDKNSKPIGYFKDYFRGDKSKFTFEIRKGSSPGFSK